MANTPATRRLALVVQVEQDVAQTYRCVARVVYLTPDGEMRNPQWHGHGHSYGEDEPADVQRFYGLEVNAYAGSLQWAGPSDDQRGLWGFGVTYACHRVENAVHAQAIARTFAQVERGMKRAEETEGYIRSDDPSGFARYVMRVAKALRIPRVYVRNLPDAYARTGERYRVADFGTLDYWTEQVTEHITRGERSALVR